MNTKPLIHLSLLCAALCAAPLAAARPAQAPNAGADARQSLQAAQEELRRAALRVAELAKAAGKDAKGMAFATVAGDRPRLGIVMAADDGPGVRITAVTPGSGADKAGLKAGDRLTHVRGIALDGSDGDARLRQAREALQGLEAGKPVGLTYQRAGRSHSASVVPANMASGLFAHVDPGPDGHWRLSRDGAFALDLDGLARLRERLPEELRTQLSQLSVLERCEDGKQCMPGILAQTLRWRGLNLAAVDAQLGRYFGTDRGVLVLANGGIDKLQAGDVILEVDGKAVDSPRDVLRALQDKPAQSEARVALLRDRKPLQETIRLPATPSLPRTASFRLAPMDGFAMTGVLVDGDAGITVVDADGKAHEADAATR